MIRVFILILFLFNSDYIISQLNPQSKKVTNTFFQDFEEIQAVTPGLKKKKGFTNYEELISFLNKFSVKYPEKVKIKYIGKSQKGKKIPILYLSDNHKSKNKLKVWLQGGLHGDEPASTESLLYTLHMLLEDKNYLHLTQKLELAILPMANIDGFIKNKRYAANSLDLNRDHTKLMAIETQVIKREFAEFDPHIALDFHEYRPYRKDFAQLSSFGIASIYDLMFLHSGNLNVPKNIRTIVDTLFVKNAKVELDSLGLTNRHYMKSDKILGEIQFSTGSNTARSSSNFFALNGSYATLFEIRGVGIGKTSFKRRVGSGFSVATSFLQTAYDNIDFLLDELDLANKHSENIVVISERSVYSDTISAIDLESNQIIKLPIIMRDAKKSKPILERSRPVFYALKSNNLNVIKKIDNLGIEKIEIKSDTIIQVEKYLVVNFKNDFKPYEKMRMQEVQTEIINDKIKFTEGDILIPLNQKKSNLIVELMEPEAPNSFISFGIMKTNLEDILTVYRINN